MNTTESERKSSTGSAENSTTAARNRWLHSEETEAALLGALLFAPGYMPEVLGLLTTVIEPFMNIDHEAVWDAMVECQLLHRSTDAVFVIEALKAGGRKDGPALVVSLADRRPLSSLCIQYAESVRQYAIFRRTAKVCTRFLQSSTGFPGETVRLLSQSITVLAKQSITDDMAATPAAKLVPGFLEYMEELKDHTAKPKSLSGIKCLDTIVDGFEAGDIVIVGGRPGLGKTALAVNLACNNLRSGRSVLFFSFEMTSRQILERLVGCWGRIVVKNISGHYGEKTLRQMQEIGEEIARKPFYVAQSMNPTLESLEQVLEQHAAKFGPPDLVVVDYLQLMTSMRRFDNRNQELTYISRGLKTLAMKAKLPMLVISQLRRPGQGDTTKNPQLHHLRDSGSIEADADVVILLGFVAIKNAGNDAILNLNVAKNRHGQAGVCQVKFQQSIQHIQDVTWTPEAEEEEEPEEELPF